MINFCVKQKRSGKENAKGTSVKKEAINVVENNGKQRARLKPVMKWTPEDNQKLLEHVRANMNSFEVGTLCYFRNIKT